MGISGLQDLYQTTVDRHAELKTLLLDNNAAGESLRKELSDFFFSFQGIKSCSTHTAAAATMVHAAAANQGFNLQIRQSLVAGIGLDSKEKEKIAAAAASTGRLPVRLLLYEKLEELRNDEWTDLLSIAVALLCFDPNKEQQFEKARDALHKAKIDNFTRPSEALAHIAKLVQDANTAFGKEFISDYDLFILIKKKLPKEIQYEINNLLADGDSKSQLECDWSFIDDTVSKAWLKYSRRPTGYYDGILQFMDQHHPDPPANQQLQYSATPTVHAAIHPSAHDSLSDMTLTCERYNEDGSVCGDEFIFNTAEQLRYKQLGFKNLPKSCMKHRGQKPQDAPKQYANNPCKNGNNCGSAEVRHCRDFQAGVCQYADKCKYAHIEKPPDIPTAHHAATTEESDEEDLIAWHMSIVESTDSDDEEREFWM